MIKRLGVWVRNEIEDLWLFLTVPDLIIISLILLVLAGGIGATIWSSKETEDYINTHNCKLVGIDEGHWVTGMDGKLYYENRREVFQCGEVKVVK